MKTIVAMIMDERDRAKSALKQAQDQLDVAQAIMATAQEDIIRCTAMIEECVNSMVRLDPMGTIADEIMTDRKAQGEKK